MARIKQDGTTPRQDEAAELVARCQAGDREAFRALFERYHSRVHATVYHLISRKDELEDVVQVVFLEVHRSIHRFEYRSLFTTWLTRVAIHVARAHERKWRLFDRPRREAAEQASRPFTVLDGEPAPGPDGELLRVERARALTELLERLPRTKREILVLAELQDLSAPEIGEVLGIPAATARTRLFYARREVARLARRQPRWVELFGLDGGAA